MKRSDSILANFYYQKVPKLPKFQGDKKGSQVNIPGVTDFKMPRNTSESTSAGVIDRRASANYAAQKGDEAERFIQDYQKKYPGMSREQANFAFNTSKNSAKNQGEIKKAGPKRSAASKALAIATNPMTALEYKVKGQDIPENFEKGERNRLDMAVDVINPFSYAQAAQDVKSGVSDGNYTQAGLGLLNFIPGKFFGKAASKLDDIAGIKPKSVDKAYSSGRTAFEPAGPRNYTAEEFRNVQNISELTPEQINQNYKSIQSRLQGIRDKGKYWDETGAKGSELLNDDMIHYHGTYGGRPIVEVKMPDGTSQHFYKSTGWAEKKGAGAAGTTADMWQVYGEHNLNFQPEYITRNGVRMKNPDAGKATKDWFIKGPDYDSWYGSNTFRDMSGGLDFALAKKYGVTADELPTFLNQKNISHNVDTYTPQYRRGGMITDPRGQWAHPGKNTRIPGGNITMQGVSYPVLAKANNGMTTMMQPGQEYSFPGADYVDEYPMMDEGGQLGDPNQPYHPITNPDGYRQQNVLSKIQKLAKTEDEDGNFITNFFSKVASDLSNKSVRNPVTGVTHSRESDYGGVNDLYNKYFGQPLKTNTVQVSKYRPTKEKDKSSVYYSVDDDLFKKQIVDEALGMGLKLGETKLARGYQQPSKEYKELLEKRSFLDRLKEPFYQFGVTPSENEIALNAAREKDRAKVSKSAAIGSHQVSRGSDERGEYISYYDKFDRTTGTGSSTAYGTGRPFEIYDRIYLDPKTGKPKLENGGSMSYHQNGLDWKPKSISRDGGWLDKYNEGGLIKYQTKGEVRAQKDGTSKKEVMDVLSNLPIYSPDARYPEYRGNVQDWTRNLEDVNVEDNPNLSDLVGFQTEGSYFDSDAPSPYKTYAYKKSVQLNPSRFTPMNNRGRVTRHELTHGAFDGDKYVPTWLADNLYNTARNKEQFGRGEHYNLMSERAPMITGTRKEILDYSGLPLDAKIPRGVYDSYMKGLMETSLRTGDLFVTPNEVAESLQGSRNATDLYNLINMENIPQKRKGGLVKYQGGGDEPTGILKSFIKGNKIKGCKRGVNCGVGTLEGEGGKGEYVPLSNAPVTWEELQVYNETNPKSKEFKNYLKNLQSQFPGLTAQQLLAAGADSARVNQRKQDLKRYDQPAEQTYDRAYHMFYRPLMDQQGRVTIPQILQQQPGGFFNFEQNVRGNYGKKKGQMGLQVEEDFSVQDPNQERLDMGMRPNVPLDESLEAGSRDSDEFLRNWYAGRVDDPRYGEIASKRIEEIPNIQVKNMRPRFMRKGYAAYYPEGTKDIYLNPEHPFSRGSSTQAHEKKHLLYHQVPQQNQEDIIKQKLVDEKIWNERNPKKAAKKNWGYGYYSDPTEVAARLAEFRMRYNLDPRKKYTADDMKAIMDAHQRRGGKGLTKDEATSNTRSGDRSVDELYEMLGNDPVRLAELNDEIVMNRRQVGNTARYGGDISIPDLQQPVSLYKTGGWLDKYQDAGTVASTNDFVGPIDPRVGPVLPPQAVTTSVPGYTGGSIVDYLKSKGYDSSKDFRRDLSEKYDVENYDFSANKNLELLRRLQEDPSLLSEIEPTSQPMVIPRRVEKKPTPKTVDKGTVNAMLNLASMSFTPNYGKPKQSFGLTGSMPRTPKRKTTPAPVSKRPEVENFEQVDQAISRPVDSGFRAPLMPAQPGTKPMSEYFPKLPSSRVSSQQPISKPAYGDSFFDQMVDAVAITNPNTLGLFANAAQLGEKAFDAASYYGTLGKNYISRKIDLLQGDDPSKTKSKINIPKPKTSSNTKAKVEDIFTPAPILTGDTIPDPDRGSRFYHLPEVIDLDQVRMGYRNRGEAGSTADAKGDTKASGLIVTPFANEYATKQDDNLGTNSIRRYKDNEIVDNQLYGGVDNKGKFHLDFGKNMKGKNLNMADFRFIDVKDFARDKSGKIILGNETSNKGIAKVPHVLTADGKEKPLNLLIPKKGKKQDETYGTTTGGRVILTTPDLKKKILVSGSLSNIDDAIKNFKKTYKTDVVRLVILDNGTYARGLRTKDKVLKKEDLDMYDKSNEKGGAGFYYYKSGGWLDNYK